MSRPVLNVDRHVLVGDGRDMHVNFYHLNTEHAESDANTEIRNVSGVVNIFGLKSEGRYAVLWVRQSTNVHLYGYGGNACAWPFNSTYPPSFVDLPPSLFRVQDSRVDLISLVDYAMDGTLPVNSPGIPCDRPEEWRMLLDEHDKRRVVVGDLDRPLLYRRH
mmetsp:Transcript_71907/g.169260  ORF Transcript_71907/g.169260 Transcript_71907/m.169260 type:complete len:162 (-) Transcript_71907:462-947(-)